MSESRLRRWQQITAASLFVGYAGYYLGRTCLSIAKPLMVEPGSGLGLGLKEIGLLDSIGVTAYAFGKVINGVVVDRLGGRRMFLFGMVATIALTAIFGLGAGFPLFVGIWGANRFCQSMGWPALVKTASALVPVERASDRDGRPLAELSVRRRAHSILLGGIVAIGQTWAGTPWGRLADWRAVFLIAAATLGVIALGTAALLRGSPRDLGLEEPSANPNNVFGDSGQSAAPRPCWNCFCPCCEVPSSGRFAESTSA